MARKGLEEYLLFSWLSVHGKMITLDGGSSLRNEYCSAIGIFTDKIGTLGNCVSHSRTIVRSINHQDFSSCFQQRST